MSVKGEPGRQNGLRGASTAGVAVVKEELLQNEASKGDRKVILPLLAAMWECALSGVAAAAAASVLVTFIVVDVCAAVGVAAAVAAAAFDARPAGDTALGGRERKDRLNGLWMRW